MQLRAVKKEVEALPALQDVITNFKSSWIQPLRKNTNVHLPFLQQLSPEQRRTINQQLANCQDLLHSLQATELDTKLKHYAKHLIDLKLTHLNGDHHGAKRIKRQFLHDDYFNLQSALQEVLYAETVADQLQQQYQQIMQQLQEPLSLDESVSLFSKPHQQHLQQVQKTIQQQKALLHTIGSSFVTLTKEAEVKS